MGYSTEQAANIAIVVGFILKFFKVEIATEELTTVISGAMIVCGTAWSWYKRYKRGDLTPMGFRRF